MCYDLNEYDPFEPVYLYYGYETYVDSEPMEDYNWQEWLEDGNDEIYCDYHIGH